MNWVVNLLLLIGSELNQDFRIYGESDEAYRIKGGNSKLIEVLQEKIKDKVPVNYGHALLKIEDNGSKFRLVLEESNAKHKTIEGPKVICTILLSVLREIEGVFKLDLSPLKKRAIDECGYGRNSKNILGFEKRFLFTNNFSGNIFTDLSS